MNYYHFLLKELIQHPHTMDKKNFTLLSDIANYIISHSSVENVTTGSILEAFRNHPETLYINKLAREFQHYWLLVLNKRK